MTWTCWRGTEASRRFHHIQRIKPVQISKENIVIYLLSIIIIPRAPNRPAQIPLKIGMYAIKHMFMGFPLLFCDSLGAMLCTGLLAWWATFRRRVCAPCSPSRRARLDLTMINTQVFHMLFGLSIESTWHATKMFRCKVFSPCNTSHLMRLAMHVNDIKVLHMLFRFWWCGSCESTLVFYPDVCHLRSDSHNHKPPHIKHAEDQNMSSLDSRLVFHVGQCRV